MTPARDDDDETLLRPGPAAVAASRRGWSVVPLFGTTDGRCHCGRADCPSAGKHPRVRWERYQGARPAESTVRRWWQRWPDANVGVVTGSVSGLVVVDVDPRHGGDATLADLEAREGRLPPTVEAFSGGGGLHLYLRHPGAAVPSGQLGPGLDVKADGGLVVAPPSRHPSGHRYEWEPGASPDEVAPAPVPAWVVDRVRAGASRLRAESRRLPRRREVRASAASSPRAGPKWASRSSRATGTTGVRSTTITTRRCGGRRRGAAGTASGAGGGAGPGCSGASSGAAPAIAGDTRVVTMAWRARADGGTSCAPRSSCRGVVDAMAGVACRRPPVRRG